MAIKLQLKRRKNDSTLAIPRSLLDSALAQAEPGKALLDLFSQVRIADSAVHDARHLEAIVYWTPPPDPQTGQGGGLSAKEDAKWFGLRQRVARLNSEVEGVLTLNQEQYDLVKSRLVDDRFRVVAPTLQWTEFVQMFLRAGGEHMPDVSDKLEEDLDAAQ